MSNWYQPQDGQTISPFLDPANTNRYIVISVDPAGGYEGCLKCPSASGALSDEAFIVFMIANHQYGLLTGRIVSGHNAKYGFSMIPLVFAVALLHTVRGVVRQLRDTYQRSNYGRGSGAPVFVVPPVIVLVENNFAYGASTYVQLLWFIRQRQRRHSDLNNVEILFATPVYGTERL